MQRSFLVVFLTASLYVAALVFATDTARADRPRRGYGPVVVVAPRPAPYYRRYAGPPPGRYGLPYYGVAVNRIFGYPATYIPYGSRVAGGYAAPMGYPDAYGTYGPAAGDWDPYANPLLQATLIENQLRWGTTLPPAYPEARTRRRVRHSTPEQQAKSLHAQAQGDVWMKRLRYLNAYERYKVAQSAASDRPEPYFRLGFSLAAVSNFDSAIKYIKQGLDLDPQWPAHGDRLDVLFGEDNRLAVLSMIERIGSWVHEDIRDPDRLFLMGVVLHFDGDTRASEFFEAAYRLSGTGDHLLAFLHPFNGPGTAPPNTPGPDLNPSAPGGPVFNGVPNGGAAAPAPQEPQEVQPQVVAPPDFGPAGPPQGLFSPPQAMPQSPPQAMPQSPPRRTYQPLPQRPRQAAPQNSRPQNPRAQVIPQRDPARDPATPARPPQGPTQRSQQPTPPKAIPQQKPNPAAPALPVPPLPAPEDPSGEPQTGGPVGPTFDGPALAPPAASDSGSTTAQSP